MKMEENKEGQQQNDNDVLMTRKEVSKWLKISLVTLNNHNRKNILKPTHKIGRRILYKKSDVLKHTEILF
jgi:predicted site-specific integrase-resolvase